MLETDRLILRPFLSQDTGAYAALNADPEVMRFLGGPRSLSESQAEIAHHNETYADRGFGKIAVIRKADDTFLGACGISVEDWYPGDFEIGWKLIRAFWGQGYATEAARAWLDDGFARMAPPRVISISDETNLGSIAVMQRLGMRLDHRAELEADGDRFEAVIYAISAADHGTRG